MTKEEQLYEALKQQHAQWLEGQTTKLVISAIKANKEQFVKMVSRDASNVSFSDQQIRHNCISIRRIDDILAIIQDYEILTAKLKQ